MLPLLLQASKRANEGAEDGKHTGHHMSEIGKRTATQNANPEKDKWKPENHAQLCISWHDWTKLMGEAMHRRNIVILVRG